MPVLLFRLNGVPDDEAGDIRALLTDNAIDYYETDAGRWGISVAAIWLRDDAQLSAARTLIDDYEQQRAIDARAAYEALRRENKHDTLWRRLRREPLAMLFYIAVILGILYLSLMPFLRRW